MAAYSVRVKQDIARWAEQGLIPASLAETLSRDVEQRERKSLSFGSILAMMAALLLGAAILVLVAANWEAIPRIGRVAALFATILAGYVGGAVLKARGHNAIGEALYIIAAAAFGGSIALIGHKRIETTLIYAKLGTGHLEAAATVLSRQFEEPTPAPHLRSVG